MANMETKNLRVKPEYEDSTISSMQRYGWQLFSSNEIHSKDSHLEQRGDSIYSVSESTHFVKLVFQRDTSDPNYAKWVALENEEERLAKLAYDFVISGSTLQKYRGSDTSISIPSNVTSIAPNAFEKCQSIMSVNIPSSVTSIGYSAFNGCTNLTSITIPSSVTSIGFCAFAECTNLTSVTIHSNNINMEWGVFADCKRLNEETKNDISKRFGEKVLKRKLFGCYIATAVYGSYNCPQVWTLRRYRDFILAKNIFGRIFIHVYYKVSPLLIKLFGENKYFNRFWLCILDRKINNLQKLGISDTPYEDR